MSKKVDEKMKNVKNIVKKYNLQKLSTKLRFGKSKVEQVLYVPEKTYRRRFKSTDEAQAMDYDEVKDFVDSLNLDHSEYPFDINIVFNYGIRQILR